MTFETWASHATKDEEAMTFQFNLKRNGHNAIAASVVIFTKTRVDPHELKGNELSWKIAPRQDGSVPITTLQRVQ